MTFKLQRYEVSDFSMVGWRLPDDRIKLDDRVIDEWPDEVELKGTIFALHTAGPYGPPNDKGWIPERAFYT